jgi:class 3 adenylate cyclase/tetratricopeptide (TPR) repeat protein
VDVCAQCGTENPGGLSTCPVCGTQLTILPTERRKLVTMLFCDVTGSTAMGERLDPEAVRELMLRYFHEMRSAIERHGGTVEKFAGDAVMAVFGVPIAHEDDAIRAVRAASEMRDRLKQLNPMLERNYGAQLRMRVGVNTGEVVTSPAGQRDTFVTGDAVNTAARLEQAAGTDEILLGELTYELAGDAVRAEPLVPVAAKGKAEPVSAYRLLAVSAGPPAIRARQTPLTGRTFELAELEDLFERATAEKSCVLATILGEPGVGKSRLAAELIGRLSGRASVHTGRCLSYGEGITYWPLAELVRAAASIHDEDSAADARRKIAALVEPAAAERVATAIGVGDESFTADDIAWAFGRLFEQLAGTRPLVALIEDLHWAERTLLDLFTRLATRAEAPILLLCTARPELAQQEADWPVALQLQPLARHEIEQLIEGYGLPDSARQRVAASARGNPLFAEELAAYLREQPDADATPNTIQALLTARLDLLTEAERAAAEVGSVEGEVFHRGPVAEAASLEGLVERGLIAPAQAMFVGQAAYRFKHVLVRDAVYNGAPKRRRADLHERFADWLVRIAGARVTEYDEILGYHLEQAYLLLADLGPPTDHAHKLARRAAEHLIAAGRRATYRGDEPATVNLLDRATELLPTGDPERLKFVDMLGASLQMTGEFERAERLLSEAIDVAVACGDQQSEVRADLQRWWSYLLLRRPGGSADDGERIARRAVSVLQEVGDTWGLARAWSVIGVVEEIRCRSRSAETAYRHAIRYASEAGDHGLAAYIAADLVQTTENGPTPVEEALRRCEEMSERVQVDRLAVAKTFTARAHLNAMRGCFDEARAFVARAAAIIDELGIAGGSYGSAPALRRAQVELYADDPAAVERELRPVWEALVDLGDQAEQPRLEGVALGLAEATYRQGRHDEAARFAQAAKAAAVSDSPLGQAEWRGIQARLLANEGDAEAAERLAREAVSLLAATDFLNDRGNRLVDLAEVLRIAGRDDEAVPVLTEALSQYEQKGNIVSAARVRALLPTASEE